MDKNNNFKLDFGTYFRNTHKPKSDTTIHLMDSFPMHQLIILPGMKGSFTTFIDEMCASFDFEKDILFIFLDILEKVGICSKNKIISTFEINPDDPLQIDFSVKPIMVTGIVLSCVLGEQTSSTKTGETFIPIIIRGVEVAQEPVAVFIPTDHATEWRTNK